MNEKINQERLRLYLIRHGEVEGAADGKLLGRTDAPLSKRGLEQSHTLAEVLSEAQLSAVYSSDLQRATITAEIIAKRSNLKVQASSAWREIDMGEWEGLTFAVLHEEVPKLIAQLFNDPSSFEYPKGESFAAFNDRVQGALHQLLTNHDRCDVALITHGGVCRAIIGNALGMPAKYWLRLEQAYCSLNVIDWYDHTPSVKSLNQICK